MLRILRVSTELGKSTFRFNAPHFWNHLQNELHVVSLVPLGQFETLMMNEFTEVCNCFD